ncbi:serine hydrolase domain-containing protein [Actinomadura sp. DC4]|uniref:serine hydrolase domain-containing protein n=1 Tax=Actinomadura sp. DC4 TaxID=3055069 RepID=UPI0025B0F46A|nr:serine hydrolase domain-containing protein [Actinomadura sp. DC4]MDN3352591.1 serine hydrolase domain-containing protein [Actinomadura sp. DC4]
MADEVHLLAERGEPALDDRVAAHWPAFGQACQDEITVRQVLRHRSGPATARGLLGDSLAMTDRDRSVRTLLRRPPGRVPAYRPIAYRFILGTRRGGSPAPGVRDLPHTESLDPLGLSLPGGRWPRHVPIRGLRPAGRFSQAYLDRPSAGTAVIPAAGASTTARDLPRFYLTPLRGGELDGVRILAPATVTGSTRPSGDGERDRLVGRPIRWSRVFRLGGPGPR